MRSLASILTFLSLGFAINGSLAIALEGQILTAPEGYFAATDGAVVAVLTGGFVATIKNRMMNKGEDEINAEAEVCGLAILACETASAQKCEVSRLTDTVGMSGYFWAPADFACYATVGGGQ